MKIPHASHPIWKLIRLALVGGILLALLHFNYKGLDARDATTILATLAALGGFDAATADLGVRCNHGQTE
jgi:hypothetical protein